MPENPTRVQPAAPPNTTPYTMMLTEILARYDDQTLADQNDVTLENAQITITDLHRTMIRCSVPSFSLSHSGREIDREHLTKIGQFVTRTLNARYGCND